MTSAEGTFKGLKLTNTLTRQKEDFVPITDDNVRMYVCGPTVYDFAHIGNARPVIVFDVLFRLLKQLYGESHVKYVRNITDVDDKINARALRDYPDLPLNEAIAKVTEKTANQFHADVERLGCLAPTVEPRATAHIDGMIEMIQNLIKRGHAYVAAGEVLFDTASMPNYGGLSKRKLEDQKAGARIAVDDHKKSPGDFVLWKQSSGEEPGWESPWGRGRPGWHIECSVMSEAHLGEIFDIHGGGLDLIFPHHENEIAQSCCAHGTDKMANVWLHNGFVQVEGKKMSKSDGNFVTINQLLDTEDFGGRKWPGEVLRLAMLMTHYREPIDFSVKRLEEAENIWRKLSGRAAAQKKTTPEADSEILGFLCDDLRSSDAIKRIQALAKKDETLSKALWGLELLGIGLDMAAPKHVVLEAESGVFEFAGSDVKLTSQVHMREEILDEADKARAAGDKELMKQKFAEADKIRDELASEGIVLKDSKDSETGKRVTTWELKR
ncbi:MAG: cysteine--tRNA ligase [Rhodobacteraceae bacterium]|nr:cysteine--tRNA ligase [Paracoccaceae bacterium]